MPVFLARLLARFARLGAWWTPVLVFSLVFFTSWPLMAIAEPPGSAIAEPATYWWYFVVTASTVGYGDVYPESFGGHLVGVYVIVGGIATLTTVFTRLSTALERAKGRRMQGSVTVDYSGHIVLLGYTPGRTEQMVDELGADGSRVVLCAWDDAGTHPLPDRDVAYVRGDLTDDGVLRRAGVQRAHSVLVDARDDNEALAVAVTAVHVADGAHLVVALRDLGRVRHLRYVDERVRCVQWHNPHMITEELKDPGITEIYTQLMTHGGGADTYSVRLPESLGPVLVDRCQTSLGRRYGATMLAARADDTLLVNPGWQTRLPAGAVLYYVGPRRLAPDEIASALREAGPGS
ncbi:potassium channel protein [Microtetraspora sp. NBRC 13810]|uniref:ion channel n=1 Tax=Microtetraspora sp. NBRC 13810 TaxID=3030990 RepID=UPI00255744BD|nr:ion channel [Microtetraspora sp. NBRC 13810]GLW08826.1 potassium channel protein [Microtetraspora sp. NBRC 13810]